jgi:hypothetical protein
MVLLNLILQGLDRCSGGQLILIVCVIEIGSWYVIIGLVVHAVKLLWA